MSRVPPRKWVALTYAVAAVAPIGSWLMLLFYAKPDSQSALDGAASMLRFTFAEAAPNRWWFIGWAVLPFCLLALAAFYLMPLALQRKWGPVHLASAVLVALYSLATAPPLGLLLLIAVYMSYRCMNGA